MSTQPADREAIRTRLSARAPIQAAASGPALGTLFPPPAPAPEFAAHPATDVLASAPEAPASHGASSVTAPVTAPPSDAAAPVTAPPSGVTGPVAAPPSGVTASVSAPPSEVTAPVARPASAIGAQYASDVVAPGPNPAIGGWAAYRTADPTTAGFAGNVTRVYTTMIAVDIVAFTDRRRDEEIRRHLRHRLYEQLREAFAMTLLPWDACYREDRGDGALVIVPPDVPPHLLLDPLAHHLLAMLRRGNRFASEPARMRLRLASHSGHVETDDHGVVGAAVNHLFRLVDAPLFREAATGSSAELSMIVSQRLYEEVLASRSILFPELYRQVEISCKETTARGWIWLSPGACPCGVEDGPAQA
ncbi:hypothetical protein [Actinomadura gamaensis]|uniref:Uncharacterized protein n=1 Tax=Actinomadura gamaensis TaxID=1763541 RepID=A0ABV9UAJ4_9ACTN